MDNTIGQGSTVEMNPGYDYSGPAKRAFSQKRQGAVICIYGTELPLRDQDLHVKFPARNQREKDIFVIGPRNMFVRP